MQIPFKVALPMYLKYILELFYHEISFFSIIDLVESFFLIYAGTLGVKPWLHILF